jgi:NAD(P)H-nitrite reductase large subunit
MKFVIIGQSPSVTAAITTIRAKDPSHEITLVSCDGQLPYDRTLFPRFLSRKVKDKEFFIEAEDFFKANGVTTVLDKEITRINFNRCRIHLSARQSLDYDVLILADTPQVRLPNMKGIRRTGVFHLARLETARSLQRYLPFMDTVVVEPGSIRGIEAAMTLKSLDKDVLLVVKTERLLPEVVSEETSAIIVSLLEKRGIRMVLATEIDDVLGENEVKALRFKTGKVVACEAVIFENVGPDFRFLEGTELLAAERVPVTSSMRTNLENVYAVDALVQMESPKLFGSYAQERAALERQGEVAALSALGEAAVFDVLPLGDRALLEKVFSMTELAEVFAEQAVPGQGVADSNEASEASAENVVNSG